MRDICREKKKKEKEKRGLPPMAAFAAAFTLGRESQTTRRVEEAEKMYCRKRD